MADLVIAQERALIVLGAGVGANFLSLVPLGPCTVNADAGTRNLTTQFVNEFNGHNLNQLPRDISYYVVGGDADRDGSGTIEYDTDRVAALVTDDPKCLGKLLGVLGKFVVARTINTAYQFLRGVSSVTVKSTPVAVGNDVVNRYSMLGHTISGGNDNDVLVTVTSAEGPAGAPFERLGRFVGTDPLGNRVGRNHSTMGDADVAEVVIPYLQDSDRAIGDLR